MKYYIISEKDLKEILDGYFSFQGLVHGGVESWEWYDDSIIDYFEACGVKEVSNLIEQYLFNLKQIRILKE